MNEELAQLARDVENTKPEHPEEWTVLVRNRNWLAVYRDVSPHAAFDRAMMQHSEDHPPIPAESPLRTI